MAPPTADFVKLLEEELESSVMPEISDLANATMDAIVRDIHKLLTGNGGPTRGMIFKQAATRVEVRLVKQDLSAIDSRVEAQQSRYDELRDAQELKDAERAGARHYRHRVTKMLWDNKGFILLIALLVTFYTVDAFRDKASDTAAERRLTQLMDKKIEQIVMSKTPIKK